MVLPAAGLLTLLGTCTAVVMSDASTPVASVSGSADRDLIAAALRDDQAVSRSAERPPLPNDAAADERVTGHLYVGDSPVDVFADAAKGSPVLATLKPGTKVDVTGRTEGSWTQIMHKDVPRWVYSAGVGKKKPKPPLVPGPCPGGSGVESGLQPDTILVHRAVCAAFPAVARWGGRSGGGEHASGRAIDIMIGSDSALGYRIADFARSHAHELGVSQVIWHQHIWTVQRSGDGWRPMSNRGGATANHMDHVHVTTYGSSGTAG